MRLFALAALAELCCCETVGPPPRKMPMLVVPLSLEASYIMHTECIPTNDANVALDYGASGAPSHIASTYKNLRYYACPEPTLEHLAAQR
jgi:hypothetical protein